MEIKIHDKNFTPLIGQSNLRKRIGQLGKQISKDYNGKELIVIGVLNGSFVFMADLCREISLPISMSFIKIKSYEGTKTSGNVKSIMGLEEELEGKNVLIVEDIVDTGISMNFLISEISAMNPTKISIATLLFKPIAFRFNYNLDYVGFEIPNKFVVGYGLDYDGLGRNIPSIYQLITS
jgi:hypoxanthine phosphoribosyltransferase